MTLSPQDYRKTSPTHRRGTRAAQPAANTVLTGTLYYVTDERATERSNGTSWETYSPAGILNYVTTAIDYTVLAADQIVNVTVAGKTITLITAVGRTGKNYQIDNASSGDITVNTTSSQTIEGQLTQTVPSNSSMSVYSDGANWRIF